MSVVMRGMMASHVSLFVASADLMQVDVTSVKSKLATFGPDVFTACSYLYV